MDFRLVLLGVFMGAGNPMTAPQAVLLVYENRRVLSCVLF